MLTQFTNYIKENALCCPTDTILLAVSGGRDSVVMCDLFARAGFSFAIAHCNFHLRGADSDSDAAFASTLAQHYKVAFFCENFNTKAYAEQHKLSIEMAAREQRYAWFGKLLQDNNYRLLATAHHLNDSIETFFINLVRGTGPTGLQGIQLKQNQIIRPLLFASRSDIDAYIQDHALSYREDLSNNEDVFLRNYIRYHIVPEFKKLNPSFEATMQDNMGRIRVMNSFIQTEIQTWIDANVNTSNEQLTIPIRSLSKHKLSTVILFELLKDKGFHPSVIDQIHASLFTSTGKQFFSDAYRLVRDRESLLIKKFEMTKHVNDVLIDALTTTLHSSINLSFETSSDIIISKDKHIATLDLDTIPFPLSVRKWEQGDYFYPYGMTQKKLLSDFFIDEKLSLFDKENVWLLCSGNEIVWVIGYRIDNRFAVTKNTKMLYKISVKYHI